MKDQNVIKQTIKCPYCNTEYLPSEIFYPEYFLGQERNIERDTLGSIIYYEGKDADHTENFTCNYCNKPFTVTAEIKFNTIQNKYRDMDDDYQTVKPIKLFLDEN